MIHAKIDVTLANHQKAHRAGRAMATWTWALLYSRDQELDGFLPDDVLRLSWVGERQARKDVDALVACGLLTVGERGWWIIGYAAKNETKAEIDARRSGTRERMRALRSGVREHIASTGAVTSGVTSGAVPGSGSGSGSDLSSRSEEPQQVTARGPAPEDLPDAPPAWWASAVATAEQTTGRTLDQASGRWLEYRAARERKGWRPSQGDAVGWIAAVLTSDARRAREGPKRRPSEIVQSAENRAYELPPEMR